MRELRLLLAAVPGLVYIALVFTLLALWTEDVRGLYIAGFCAVLGVVQVVRDRPR
jgi:hypothetical protein